MSAVHPRRLTAPSLVNPLDPQYTKVLTHPASRHFTISVPSAGDEGTSQKVGKTIAYDSKRDRVLIEVASVIPGDRKQSYYSSKKLCPYSRHFDPILHKLEAVFDGEIVCLDKFVSPPHPSPKPTRKAGCSSRSQSSLIVEDAGYF